MQIVYCKSKILKNWVFHKLKREECQRFNILGEILED